MKHPGRTAAQRRALDAIGCGDFSPPMPKATRDVLLRDGLVVPCGHKMFGTGPFAVRVQEYCMPVNVHIAWCEAVAHEEEKE